MGIKIPTVQEMESKLLQNSVPEDINIPNDIQEQPDKILDADDIRRDISVMARTFINVYCGWPFYNEVLKRTILQFLTNMYDNAHNMTAQEFCQEMSQLIAKIPDKHMALRFAGNRFSTQLGLVRKKVGKNITERQQKYSVELYDGVAIIALPTLSGWSDSDLEKFQKLYTDILPKSVATIIDLRGNSGGSSRISDPLANYLYGAKGPSSKKTWMRNTTEANIIYNRKWDATGISKIETSDDPFIKSQSDGYPKFESEGPGYRKPIYILINGRTSSSAEMFCTRLKQHPFVKFIGENTAGCEVYGNAYGIVVLPKSHITFVVGMDYRELFQDNFELNGYTPDIKCDGDAYDAAWKHLQNKLKNNKVDTNRKSR
ncbi:MAG: hypothetical protein J5742_02900 [Alphaproteobacteria bacterium]|nr:hypothetical protein [Alphaproteobacteria bacterium]